LQEKGYSRNTTHLYTQALEHFGFWRAKYHRDSQSVQTSEVNSLPCAMLAAFTPLGATVALLSAQNAAEGRLGP
jgi:hypothetical protein